MNGTTIVYINHYKDVVNIGLSDVDGCGRTLTIDTGSFILFAELCSRLFTVARKSQLTMGDVVRFLSIYDGGVDEAYHE